MNELGTVAYFSMEIGLEEGMPTYSGGLGILAGDTIRSAADLTVPIVGVTLLYRKGYFHQSLDAHGWQREEPVPWAVSDFLEEMSQRVAVTVEGRTVQLRSWKYTLRGVTGFEIPVYFLDADLPANSAWDRGLTDFLYGGDQHYRLCQEVILGIGGVKMLRALGYHQIKRFHMNEGHASLLTLELLDEEMQRLERPTPAPENIEIVRGQCVFTTHTPVPAGHDQFPRVLVEQVLGRQAALLREELWYEGKLNMTYLALNLSRYVNGVAKSHGEVSRLLFAGYEIDSITNGVHVATWTSPPFQDLYDRYIPGWKQDNFSLRYAFNIPSSDIWQAHSQAKKQLLQYVNRETNAGMQTDVLTIGFGRRATSYKRADLLFQKIERLKEIVARTGPLQLVYAGKAHPRDHEGKVLIQRVFQAKEALHGMITVAYLENYDVAIGKLITAGVDVWLNTPQPPLEASGTSGMKAALNGVPSLSVLDGWWIEGYIERKTGWAIGANERKTAALNDHARDAALLYETLEHAVLPVFYRAREQFIDMMRHCIALNGAFFNTQRMLQEYVLKAYL